MGYRAVEKLLHHPQWYMHSGDMVIKAEGTAFRIPRAMLIGHSQPLRSLLEDVEERHIIDPKNQHWRYDGCPKVTLQHDKHEDWNMLLCLLSDPNFLRRNLGPTPWQDIARTFSLVAGILRLSTKYKMYPQRRVAVDVLAMVIPTGSYQEMLAMNNRNPYFKTIPNIPREIVYLSREVNLGKFLPWAFYELSRNSTGTITTYRDLNGNDRSSILAGRDIVIQMQRVQIYKSFTYAFQPAPNCVNRPRCHLDRESVQGFENMLNMGPGPLVLINPDNLHDQRLCSGCLSQARREVREGQKRLWDSLPNIFGLGNWQQLYQLD